MKPHFIVSFIILFFFCSSIELKAQEIPVQVTGGSVTVESYLPVSRGTFQLRGDNFVINSNFDEGNDFLCHPCRSGQVTNMGLIIAPSQSSGTATINGTDYFVFYETHIVLSTPSITFPLLPRTLTRIRNASDTQTFVVPLTINGNIRGCRTPPYLTGCSPGYVFQYRLSGHGQAVLRANGFLWSPGSNWWSSIWLYQPANVVYTFSPLEITEEN